MVKIDFEFDTPYGVFRDALHLPDDHALAEAGIQALKEQRRDHWVSIVSGVPSVDPYFAMFVPSDKELLRLLLQEAGVSSSTVFFDLGAGDGGVLLEAAKLGARCVGIELDPALLQMAQETADQNQVQFELRNEDFRSTDLTGATCVYLYQSDAANSEVLAKLIALPSGTKVITQTFEFTGLKQVAQLSSAANTGYIYEVV